MPNTSFLSYLRNPYSPDGDHWCGFAACRAFPPGLIDPLDVPVFHRFSANAATEKLAFLFFFDRGIHRCFTSGISTAGDE